MRRVRCGEMRMCGGGVRSILLFRLVARCLETIDVCIWRMFVRSLQCPDLSWTRVVRCFWLVPSQSC